MKISYNETMEKSCLSKDLELCKRYNYDYIEIRLSFLRDYMETHAIDELKTFFKENHLKPYAFNSVDNINFCNEADWQQVEKLFTFACKMCRELDNPYIVIVPTANETMKEKSEEAIFEDSVAVLRKLSDIARPYGAKLAFEPIGNKRWCVRSIKQAGAIINAVGRDNVGLTIDTFNLYAHAGLKDMEDLREIPVEKLFVFHINDAMDLPLDKLEPDAHRLYPGDGVIPLKQFCTLLNKMGYDGIASLELFGQHFQEVAPETVIREGYAKTNAVLDIKNGGKR